MKALPTSSECKLEIYNPDIHRYSLLLCSVSNASVGAVRSQTLQAQPSSYLSHPVAALEILPVKLLLFKGPIPILRRTEITSS